MLVGRGVSRRAGTGAQEVGQTADRWPSAGPSGTLAALILFSLADRSMASQIRIIGGQWKRSVLPVPERDGLRPTPDRVRETLFNWLGQSVDGWRCLDVFAGTGALGLEAASRGAAKVVLLEQDPGLVRQLQDSVRRLKGQGIVDVIRTDAERWLKQMLPVPQDLILLDPPFRAGWVARILPAVLPWRASDGLIYVESDEALSDAWLAQQGIDGLRVIRAGRAGQVHYHLLAAA